MRHMIPIRIYGTYPFLGSSFLAVEHAAVDCFRQGPIGNIRALQIFALGDVVW